LEAMLFAIGIATVVALVGTDTENYQPSIRTYQSGIPCF
jgi:hypothetical protein